MLGSFDGGKFDLQCCEVDLLFLCLWRRLFLGSCNVLFLDQLKLIVVVWEVELIPVFFGDSFEGCLVKF